jgi:hypothetical protein
MSIIRRGAALAAVAAVTLGVAVGIAAPASAEGSQDCTGNSGGICLYFNSGEHGARDDALGDVWNYGVNPNSYECNGAAGCPPYIFSYTDVGSNGYGYYVKNHAASACIDSQNGGLSAYIYFNSGYQGSRDTLGFGHTCINLSHTYNNNASQQFF